jgi:hypothetical protein
MTSRNGLHHGTAALIRAVDRMAAERGGPYVTFRIASWSLIFGRTCELTGGCRAVSNYVYRASGWSPDDQLQHHDALVEHAEAQCRN